nr:mitogen-activated protein kinase kinase kinase 1-like [Ipomoea batatas]
MSQNLSLYTVSAGSLKRSIKNWRRGKVLGSGSFGTVYEGITDDGRFFAVKEVSLIPADQERIDQLQQEISLLSKFEHENIVRYLGTDKDDSNLYVFLELVSKGSLMSLYRNYRLHDTQVTKLNDIKSTKGTLLWMAPEFSVLEKRSASINHLVVVAEVSDFNQVLGNPHSIQKLPWFVEFLSEGFNDVPHSWLPLKRSIKNWRRGKVLGSGSFGTVYEDIIWYKSNWHLSSAADGLGFLAVKEVSCIISRIRHSVRIDQLQQVLAVLYQIGGGKLPSIPEDLSEDAKDFIRKCLQVNPSDRPTALDLLQHPYLRTPPSHMPSTSRLFNAMILLDEMKGIEGDIPI